MRILYYDCFGGISGDMNLAAFVDMGVDAEWLSSELCKLGIGGWRLEASKASTRGIFGTRIDVVLEDSCSSHKRGSAHGAHCHHAHRTFADIKSIIEKSKISKRAKSISLDIFEKIAKAESKVHGKKQSEVHIHEVGALDSIIDIVGAAICAEKIGADKVVSSMVELGGGTVKCAHSVMPVPAPAVAEIARAFEIPCSFGGAKSERTTPTGIAILASLCESFSDSGFKGKILSGGIGIGHRSDENDEVPNFLRIRLCESSDSGGSENSEKMCVLESNIDDDTPEMLSLLCERLFEAGAADVWQEPIVMKKGRMASKVSALVSERLRERVMEEFFKNSTTLGIRKISVDRFAVPRKVGVKNIGGGEKIRVKIAEKRSSLRGSEKAEFDDVKKLSSKIGIRKTLEKIYGVEKTSHKNSKK